MSSLNKQTTPVVLPVKKKWVCWDSGAKDVTAPIATGIGYLKITSVTVTSWRWPKIRSKRTTQTLLLLKYKKFDDLLTFIKK